MFAVRRVPPPFVPEVWPSIAGPLETAVRRCKDDTMMNVFTECITAKAQLWTVTKDGSLVGTFVTEVLQGPTRRVLEIRYLAGGKFRDWIGHIDAVIAWARAARCDDMRFKGRLGWPRYLAGSGWKPTAVEMEYQL